MILAHAQPDRGGNHNFNEHQIEIANLAGGLAAVYLCERIGTEEARRRLLAAWRDGWEPPITDVIATIGGAR